MKSRSKPRNLRLGTVSSGTLRPEDLIPAILSDLAQIRLTRGERATVREIQSDSEAADEDSAYWTDEAPTDLDTLCQIAENHVPDFCYFGTLEGDGAEIGVWISESSIGDYVHDGEIVRVNSGDTFPRTAAYVLSVSDHGNQTLYRKAGSRWIEIWSIV